jgi:hypothetical protein
MYHPRVFGLICTKLVHPKNLNKEPLHIEKLHAFRNGESLREGNYALDE